MRTSDPHERLVCLMLKSEFYGIEDENDFMRRLLICDDYRTNIDKCLEENLNRREYDAITLRFGLNGEAPHTLDETGKKLGLKKREVRRLEAVALKMLKTPKCTSYVLRAGVFRDVNRHDASLIALAKMEAGCETPEEFLSLSEDVDISVLELSPKTEQRLRRAGLSDLRDILRLNPEALLRVKGLRAAEEKEIIIRAYAYFGRFASDLLPEPWQTI